MNFQFKKIRIKNTKIVFIVLILLLIFCILSYSYLFYVSYSKDEFEDLMLSYLENHPKLKLIIYLLDSRRDLKEDELNTIEYLKSLEYKSLKFKTKLFFIIKV